MPKSLAIDARTGEVCLDLEVHKLINNSDLKSALESYHHKTKQLNMEKTITPAFVMFDGR